MARPIHQCRTASKESYKGYKILYPNTKLTFKQYKEIIFMWNKLFMEHIMTTGEVIKMPCGMGPFGITKVKSPPTFERNGEIKINRPIDWVQTKKLGKRIYIMNYHTEGFRFWWLWWPDQTKLKYSYMWRFEPARIHSRKLAYYLKLPDSPYRDLYKELLKNKTY